LAAWGDVLMFGTLDIAKEPSSQGFELGSYDVVIASRTMQPLSQILINVQALLKPGGKLLMAEAPYCELDKQLVLGLLREWWDAMANDLHPTLDLASWHTLLKNAGFSGVDVAAPNCKEECAHQTSTIISTVPSNDSTQLPSSDNIILVT